MTEQHRAALRQNLADLDKMHAEGEGMARQIHEAAAARLAEVQRRLAEPRGDDYAELIMERGHLNQVLAGGPATE